MVEERKVPERIRRERVMPAMMEEVVSCSDVTLIECLDLWRRNQVCTGYIRRSVYGHDSAHRQGRRGKKDSLGQVR